MKNAGMRKRKLIQVSHKHITLLKMTSAKCQNIENDYDDVGSDDKFHYRLDKLNLLRSKEMEVA